MEHNISKGKERASSSWADPNGSLLSRIGGSTTALLREAIIQPQPEYVGSTLSAASSGSGKGVASSSASHGQFRRYEASKRVSFENNNVTPISAEAFRMQSPEFSDRASSAQHEFDMFSVSSRSALSRPLVRSESCKREHSMYQKRQWTSINDGAAVVDILSSPNAPIDEELGQGIEYASLNVQAQRSTTNTRDQNLSCQTFSSPLASPNRRTLSSKHLLQLIPKFTCDSQVTNEPNVDTLPKTACSGLEKVFCHEQSVSRQSHYLDAWLDILTIYQDEVWGDMLPLVRQARQEVKDANIGRGIQHRPAIKRLGMILGHFDDQVDPTY
ncbi:hypothetical protein MMC13_008381 [Lambiella insularis]|nr:hypothetical protein [Lambiella insularis]